MENKDLIQHGNVFCVLKFESANHQQSYLTWKDASEILKSKEMKERDIRMFYKCLEIEETFSRQIVSPRPDTNSIILILEHFKVKHHNQCIDL